MESLFRVVAKDTGLKEVVGGERFKAMVERQGTKLFGGPMLGCVTDRSARVWLRTAGTAKVQLVYGG